MSDTRAPETRPEHVKPRPSRLVRVIKGPFTLKGRWSTLVTLGLALLVLLTPAALCAATLPGYGQEGFFDVPDEVLWYGDLQLISITAPGCRPYLPAHPGYFTSQGCEVPAEVFGLHGLLWVVFGLSAFLLTVILVVRRADHGLVFGCLTVLAVLAALAVFVSVSARRAVEDQAGSTFFVLAALGVLVLVLTAYDWARRQFLVAAAVIAFALSLFIVRVGFESLKVPSQLERVQVAARAIAAERILKLQYRYPPPKAAEIKSPALDKAICTISPRPDNCRNFTLLTITTNGDWVVARHELDVQLATFRMQVTRTDADKAALKTVLAQEPDADEDISIMSAIAHGPEILWRSFHHADGPALIPGPLGWVVLGTVLLGLLSWLLRVNANQLAGPVSVMPDQSADGGGGPHTDDRLVTALRVAVLQNVAEPGAAPGSPSVNPVTTLLGAAGGPLSAVNKVVQAVLGVIGQRYGYKVTMDVSSGSTATDAPAGSGTTTVLVRVMSLTSGITYASHVRTLSDDTEAVKTAGLWAAGYILNRSTRIPGWAAWQPDTAGALIAAKDPANHTVTALRDALMDAPTSGLLLVTLGHRYELAGQTLDAIGCYARAVTAHPRYVVARYRLGGGVGLMRPRQGWKSQGKDERRYALQAVEPAIRTLGTEGMHEICALKEDSISQEKAKENLGELAVILLKTLEIETRWYYRLVGTLRRSERSSVWPTLVPATSHPAARFHSLVKSARRATGRHDDLKKLARKANKHDTWWQVSYNAACGYATYAETLPCPSPTQDLEGLGGSAARL
jgi:hypothetical protein